LLLVDLPDGRSAGDFASAIRQIVGPSAIAGLEYDRALGGTTEPAAYVFLEDGRLLNEIVIRRGFATARRDQPGARYYELLIHAEEDARRAKRGFWASRSEDAETEMRLFENSRSGDSRAP
jgi:endonuclease YncB( thermonuclease family)